MADWKWLLANAEGSPIAQVSNSPSRKLTARRSDRHTADVALAYEDDEYADLIGLLQRGDTPQLHVYRAGFSTPRFAGELVGMAEQVGQDGESEIVATFGCPFARMLGDGDSSGRFTAGTVEFAGTDQGLILWSLVHAANGIADTKIKQGVIDLTKARDRVYESKNIGEAFLQMAAVLDGPDFELAPIDPVTNGGKLAELNVMARQGTDRAGAVFGYGTFGYGASTVANVRELGREWHPPTNIVRVLNADGLEGSATDPDSIARFGAWEQVVSEPDVVEQSTLAEKALDLIRPTWTRVVTFTPEAAAPNCPQPWDDYWLGDTVRLYADEDGLQEDVQPRVNAVAVTLDADDSENHELTVEATA